MPIVYVTGVAGTGKSAIQQLLQSKGYTAYDADLGGMSHWRNVVTNKAVSEAEVPAVLDEQWHATHQWRLSVSKIAALAESAGDETVFLCGTSANDEDFHHLLATVVFLTIDEATLRYRLAHRTSNTFGKTEADVNHVLHWLKPAEEYYRKFGAVMLDSTQPIEDLVDQVLLHTGLSVTKA